MTFLRGLRKRRQEALPSAIEEEKSRQVRLIEELRQSNLFDNDWYRSQLDCPPADGADLIEHYVRTTPGTGMSPNPCFVPSWYVSQPECPKKLDVEPFVHFVTRGGARGISPHPLFDAKQYLADHPDSKGYPGGPLGHYLQIGWRQGACPHSRFDPTSYQQVVGPVTGPPFAHFARQVAMLLRRTRGYEHLPRTSAHFDHEASRTFVRDVIDSYRLQAEAPPLVSIVIPTKDRAAGVAAAVQSVLQQTYQHWELMVVDDGSSDSTQEALQPFVADPRITIIRREQPGGVSVARNEGLVRAVGEYVAYLDSDNTWTSNFLEVMVAFTRTRKLRFAYAVSELVEDKPGGQRGYRSLPFNREALLERNYIDCIVVLHERSLLQEVGMFDEHLRRNVDWDLFIRMAQLTNFEQAPFIATSYDAWEQRSDRITLTEPFGYRYVILAKHGLDWGAAASGVGDRPAGSVSIVIHVNGRSPHLMTTVDRLLKVSEKHVEVVIVDAKLPDEEAMALQLAAVTRPGLTVLRQAKVLSAEVGRSLGACQATGSLIVFLTSETYVEPGWLAPLLRPLEQEGTAATQPLVLAPDGTVWSAGLSFTRGALAHQMYRGFPGDAPEVLEPGSRQALTSRVLAVRAEDLIRAKGFEPLFVNDLENGDLTLRIGLANSGVLAYVPDSVVSLLQQPGPSKSRAALPAGLDNVELVIDRWRDTVVTDADDVWKKGGYRVLGYRAGGDTDFEFDPVVVSDRPQRPLRWSIKIGAPTVARRTSWGDWHFALALKQSLERLGHEAVVDCRDAWNRPTAWLDDITLVLRGVAPLQPNPQHVNLMWIISHPERVTPREAAAYDAVFAASPQLTKSLGHAVEPLLQCTDQHRFHPVEPDLTRRHEVLFVGNARGVRPSVATAFEAGIVPTVYGLRWEGLLPDGAWAGSYVRNEDLPAVYSGAGVVLNDHWEDMRREGLLSNRLFDLAACGARVVSDDVRGLQEIFGEAVLTYSTPQEFRAAVAIHLAESEERRAMRAELSELVRRRHTFDARARRLVAVAQGLQAERRCERVK